MTGQKYAPRSRAFGQKEKAGNFKKLPAFCGLIFLFGWDFPGAFAKKCFKVKDRTVPTRRSSSNAHLSVQQQNRLFRFPVGKSIIQDPDDNNSHIGAQPVKQPVIKLSAPADDWTGHRVMIAEAEIHAERSKNQ